MSPIVMLFSGTPACLHESLFEARISPKLPNLAAVKPIGCDPAGGEGDQGFLLRF